MLADASGAVAAVELGARAVAVESAPLVCRTNHFTTTALAPETLTAPQGDIDDTSVARRVFLDRTLPGRAWDVAEAAPADGHPSRRRTGRRAPVPAPGRRRGRRTISSVIYCCAARVMYVCLDNPCTGSWQRIGLDA